MSSISAASGRRLPKDRIPKLALWMLGLGVAWLVWAAEGPVAQVAGQQSKAKPRQAPSEDQIADWIDQLSDDVYAVRQLAADQLLGAGGAAREQLLVVAEGPDPEVRAAAKRLVALIEETEFQRRLSAFAADTDGELGLTLPGWEDFQKLVGSDAAARSLFVEMQQQEAELLSQVFSERPPADESFWEQRLLRLLHRRAMPGRGIVAPTLGSCATMVFVGSLDKPGVSSQSGQLVLQLIQRPPLREALAAEPKDAARRLVVAWIVNCPGDNPMMLQRRLELILKHQLSEALPLAIAVSHGDPNYLTVSPNVRMKAILAVAKLGKPEHAAELEPLLEDETVCVASARSSEVPNDSLPEVQLRDIALAAMLQLNGLDLKDYGFKHIKRSPTDLFDVNSLGMASDAERQRAVAKWRKWKKEHGAGR